MQWKVNPAAKVLPVIHHFQMISPPPLETNETLVGRDTEIEVPLFSVGEQLKDMYMGLFLFCSGHVPLFSVGEQWKGMC